MSKPKVAAGGSDPAGVGVGASVGALLAAWVAVALGVVVVYAGARWLAVVTLVLTDGALVAAWVASAVTLGAVVLRRVFRVAVGGPLGFASAAGVGLGAMSLLALGLGLAGWLNRGTAVGVLLIGPLLWLASAWPRLGAMREVRVDRWLARSAGGRWLLLAAAPPVALMLVGGSVAPGLLWKPSDPHPYDALEYHLQVPREWYERGRIEGLRHNVFSYFPFGVEAHYLLAMHVRGGPWAAMYQCQFFGAMWWGIAAVAVYGASRRTHAGLGASSDDPDSSDARALPSAAAVLTVATPWSIMLGSVAYAEGALAMYAVLAVAWALRAVATPGAPLPADGAKPPAAEASRVRVMAVAGCLAGFACGVKYTAVPMVLGAVGVAAVVAALRDLRGRLKPLAAYAVVGVLVASPWLIRNLAWTGNPVFPLAMSTLGKGHFDDVQVERFRLAHSPPAAHAGLAARAARTSGEIFNNWQFGYVLWPAAAAALALTLRDRGTCLIAGYLVVVLVVWVGFTHLLGRFFVLTIPVAALGVGRARLPRWPAVASVAAVAAVVVGWAVVHAPLQRFTAMAKEGLFGLDDMTVFVPQELSDMGRPGVPVRLVGDAQGFLYANRSADLHYRTVFDLPGDARDMWEAWLGVPEAEARGLIVLHPIEVERLSRTYYKVPGLPKDYPFPRDEVKVIRR